MHSYHTLIIAAMVVLTIRPLKAENPSWEQRQLQEISELKKAFGLEEENATKDLVYQDKKFMEKALEKPAEYFEDSISSKLAAPQRKKSLQKTESDEQIEFLVPKSNPFERKFRRR